MMVEHLGGLEMLRMEEGGRGGVEGGRQEDGSPRVWRPG